jgi:hypothetical protein
MQACLNLTLKIQEERYQPHLAVVTLGALRRSCTGAFGTFEESPTSVWVLRTKRTKTRLKVF